MRTAVFGGGCFWCTEAAFKEVDGVKSVISGYAGGDTEEPDYREVSTGETGHAEVVKVKYDEEEIDYRQLLELFFLMHDPTQKDQQGPDKGTQYRSIILYNSEEQKDIAEDFLEQSRQEYDEEIHTEVKELEEFYRAEDEHQDYFEKNPEDAYCQLHVRPKVEKVRDETQ